MIYNEGNETPVPNLDLLTLLFESKHCAAKEDTPLHAEAKHPQRGVITKSLARSLTKQFAYFLRNEYGIGKSGPGKDVVVTASIGQSALACLFYGVIAADGLYSAASTASTVADLARQVKDGPGKVIVCSDNLKDLALAAARSVGLPDRNVLVLHSYPEIKLESADGSTSCDFRNELSWRTITDPFELEKSKICILYSSGTTGLPKGVLISHTNIVSECFIPLTQNRMALEKFGNDFPKRTIAHLPTAHIAGVQGYFVNPFFDAGIVYWMPSFNFEDFVRYAAELECTLFFSVPPIYMAIAKHPAVTDQFKHIRMAISGAAPLSGALQEAAGKKFPLGDLTQTWGLSETTGSVTHTPLNSKNTQGSLSPLLPNVTMRLVDENEKDVPVGQPGEALLKGPMITKGYHNNPEADKTAFTADGWFRTGDILKMENNLPYIVDRKNELIKYKALQVAPAELEGLLISHSAVADAAVIGTPRNGTEVPTAFVALNPAAKGKITEAELASYVQANVADYKRLRGGVFFVDVVPRSPAGKILRKELRTKYGDGVEAALKSKL